jgi:hypothetical protein
LLAALSAGHVHFDFLFGSGTLGRGDSRQSVVLGVLARLAPLGLVLQALVVEENLLAHGPHELFIAIDASDRSVRKFRCLAVRRPLQLNVWHAVHLPARLRRGNVGKLLTVVASKKTDEEANERRLAYELKCPYESAATAAATYMTMLNSCQAFFCAARSANLRLSIFAFH